MSTAADGGEGQELTLLDRMVAHYTDQRRAEIKAFVKAEGYDENNPAVVIGALTADLREVAERIPDRIAEATATLEERTHGIVSEIGGAFDSAAKGLRSQAAQVAAEQLTGYQAAFEKVAIQELKAVSKAIQQRAESPWHKYLTIIVVVVAGLLVLGTGMWIGRIQQAQTDHGYVRSR